MDVCSILSYHSIQKSTWDSGAFYYFPENPVMKPSIKSGTALNRKALKTDSIKILSHIFCDF